MAELFPGLAQSIGVVLAGLVGIVALWYGLAKIVPWVQRYRNAAQTDDQDALRKKIQQEDQQANSDSDALEQREREHDSPKGPS